MIIRFFVLPSHSQKQNSRACGEIGRRARLRIWCFATCRFESYHAHDWTKEEFSKQGIPLSCFENRQCRQRLVKRRMGEARTVWAAIRRRCQFKRYNRQGRQQLVTRSTAPVVSRGLRKASVVNLKDIIGNASSKKSREAPRQWCRVGCEKRVLSIFITHERRLVSHKRR